MALHEGRVELSWQRVLFSCDLVKTAGSKVRLKFGGPSGRKSEPYLKDKIDGVLCKTGGQRLTS